MSFQGLDELSLEQLQEFLYNTGAQVDKANHNREELLERAKAFAENAAAQGLPIPALWVTQEKGTGIAPEAHRNLARELKGYSRITVRSLSVPLSDGDKSEHDTIVKNFNRGKFMVVVTGPMKAGKSTLINCLVRTPLLPSRSFAMTILPTVVEHKEGQAKPLLVIPMTQPMQEAANFIAACNQIKQDFGNSNNVWCMRYQKAVGMLNDAKGSERDIADACFNKQLFGNSNSFPTKAEGADAGEVLMKANIVFRVQFAFNSCFAPSTDAGDQQALAEAREKLKRYWSTTRTPEDDPMEFLKKLENAPILSLHLPLFAGITSSTSISLVDTPGPNEAAVSKSLKDVCKRVCEDADATIFVVDAQTFQGADAVTIKSEILQTKAVIKKPLFLVLNRFDVVNQNKVDPVALATQYQKQGAEMLLDDSTLASKVSIVSALQYSLSLEGEGLLISTPKGKKCKPSIEYLAYCGGKLMKKKTVEVALVKATNPRLKKMSNMASLDMLFTKLAVSGHARVIHASGNRLKVLLESQVKGCDDNVKFWMQDEEKIQDQIRQYESLASTTLPSQWEQQTALLVKQLTAIVNDNIVLSKPILKQHLMGKVKTQIDSTLRVGNNFNPKTGKYSIFGNKKADEQLMSVLSSLSSHVRLSANEFGFKVEGSIGQTLAKIMSTFNSNVAKVGLELFSERVKWDASTPFNLARDSTLKDSARSSTYGNAFHSNLAAVKLPEKPEQFSLNKGDIKKVTRSDTHFKNAESFTGSFIDTTDTDDAFIYNVILGLPLALGAGTLSALWLTGSTLYGKAVGDKNWIDVSSIDAQARLLVDVECDLATHEWSNCLLNYVQSSFANTIASFERVLDEMNDKIKECKGKRKTEEQKRQLIEKSQNCKKLLETHIDSLSLDVIGLLEDHKMVPDANEIDFECDFNAFRYDSDDDDDEDEEEEEE